MARYGRQKYELTKLSRNYPIVNHRKGNQTWDNNKPSNILLRLKNIKGCNSNNLHLNKLVFC